MGNGEVGQQGGNGSEALVQHKSLHRQLATLRMLVGYLGEKDQFNWWDCRFLSPNGLKFLEINFPRTVLAAGVTSVTAAAGRFHDERIGKKDVFHLFRLPAGLEEAVHNALPSGSPTSWTMMLASAETAITQLETMAKGTIDAPVGPVQVGAVATLTSYDAISEIAKHYKDAFAHGKLVLPYFRGASA